MKTELNDFIVRAKQATYVGGGGKTSSSRPGSHDLCFEEGDWAYRDSYFGGTDFLGQEVVWLKGEPVWVMNYYGYILRPDLIDGQRGAETIQLALSQMYAEGRFLGGFVFEGPHGRYVDFSNGDVAHFSGREEIYVGDVIAYALDYHGGFVKP
ncbi:MAG TPA: hypothetical protein ENK61_05325 [Devosia sp.]|nr:hypothetical protein [Devosia sp.]